MSAYLTRLSEGSNAATRAEGSPRVRERFADGWQANAQPLDALQASDCVELQLKF